MPKQRVDAVTEPWGVKVEPVQMKKGELLPGRQRAMAMDDAENRKYSSGLSISRVRLLAIALSLRFDGLGG